MEGEIIMNKEKIELYINDFYKNLDKVRLNIWNYEDGCILLAAMELFKVTKNNVFREFVIEYVSNYVLEDGTIKYYTFDEFNLDNIAPGRALLFAYDETGEERFFKAAKLLMEQLKVHPRTKGGNFWHKKIYPNQVWLDGLFMAQPFYMEYVTKYEKKEGYQDIISQFKNVHKNMFQIEKGLYYHGYDESRSVFWADKETGCSKNYWLRAIGWFQMGLIETMDVMSKAMYEHYTDLEKIFKESLKGILKYQDPVSKLFYQLVDEPTEKGNYIETSGSAMLAASILKACRMRIILPEKYWCIGEEILNNIIEEKLVQVNGKMVLKDICKVAGLGPEDNTRRNGSAEYYLSEPIIADDLKGVAALFMAYAEYLIGCNS